MGVTLYNSNDNNILSVKFSGDPLQEENFNLAIREWAEETNAILVSNVERIATKGKRKAIIFKKKDGVFEKKLSRSITFNINKTENVTDRVRFSFERHGVYLEKGVGRGNRRPEVWFNDSIDKQVEKLADIAQENAVKLSVKGYGIKIR